MHIWMLWTRSIGGLENIPRGKAFIIALNHSSYYDTGLVHALLIPLLDKKVHPFVNSSYWKYKFVARIFLSPGEAIPIYIKKEDNYKQKNKKAFNKALYYAKKGEPLMIFPEGKRSKDGKLGKAYTGIAKLALKAKIPVIPMGVIGSNKVWPKGKTFPRFKRCDIKIGKPIYFEDYYNKKPTEYIYEQVTRIIMKEIAKLIGQKYDY